MLEDFFASLPHSFWANCEEARINESRMEPEAVSRWKWPEADELIFLKAGPSGLEV